MMQRKIPLTPLMIGLATTLAGLMLLEGLSRVILTVRADLSWPQLDWYQYASDVGWERRPHFKGLVAGELRRQDPARYQREFDAEGFFSIDSDQVQGTGHKKILAIGDSNTFGWGVPSTSAFSEVLDVLRADADVINLGVSGHTSFQGYEMLVKHFDQVRPDVIIASYGFNDRRVVPSESAIDSRQKFERDALSRRFDLLRGRIYLFRMIQIVMSKVGLIKNGSDQDMVVDARQARTRVSPEQYRQNLGRIAQFCKERHVPLVFIVFQDNPAYSEHLRAGIAHQNSGRYEEAEAELRIALNMDNWFSDLARKHLAALLAQRGDSADATAMARFTLSAWTLEQGGKLLHLDVEYNDIMRSVASEYGAAVVEAGQRLVQDASLYLDLAHPDERGHRLIAGLLNRELNALLDRPHATVQSAPALPGS
ncbi:MAG: GDSL-type esterase/lipase family protein [Nitrospira sp.]